MTKKNSTVSIGSVFFALFFVMYFMFTVLAPEAVYAYEGNPYENMKNVARWEYLTYKSYKTIFFCVDPIGSSQIRDIKDFDYNDSGGIWKEDTVSLGLLFKESDSNGRIGCSDAGNTGSLLKNLGFNSHYEFIDFIWPHENCKDGTCPSKFKSRSELDKALETKLLSKKVSGTDYSVLGVDKKLEAQMTDAANYYYYDEIFKRSEICGGKYYKNSAEFAGSGDDNGNDSRGTYKTIVVKDGANFAVSVENNVVTNEIVTYSKDGTIEKLDDQMLIGVGCASYAEKKNEYINGFIKIIYDEQAKCFSETNSSTCFSGTDTGVNDLPSQDSGGKNPEEAKPTCEVHLNSPMSWVLCPVLNLVDRLVDYFINEVVLERLEFSLDNADEAPKVKEVWNGFRILANVIFVVAFLAAIFGQATSFIDAYTIKKMLPRLVIAAILIQLSFFLCILAVNITNVLGSGIESLMAAPWGGIDNLNIDLKSLSAGGEVGLFAGLMAGVIGVVFGGISLLGLAIAAFFAVFAAIITIVFRESILYLLVVTSPVALALWAIPSADRFARMWSSLFMKVLMMYPLIVAFLTMGKILGASKLQAVSDSTGAGASPVSSDNTKGALDAIVAVVLFFGPAFLIPFTFKFAGGAIATIGGFASKMGGGLSAGAKKRAQAKSAERRAMAGANIKAGQLPRFMGGNTAIGKRFGQGVGVLAAGPKGWLRGKRGISASMETGQMRRAALSAETEAMKAIATNDKAAALLAQAENASHAKRLMEDYIKKDGEGSRAIWEQAHASAARVGYGNAGARRQAYDMWTRSGYNFEDGEGGYNQLARTARSISGGDDGMYSNLMNQGQYNAKNAGLAHLGGINNGTGYSPETGFAKLSEYQLGQLKPQSFKEMGETYLKARSSGDIEGEKQWRSVLEGVYSNANLKGKQEIAAIKKTAEEIHGPGLLGLPELIDRSDLRKDELEEIQNRGGEEGQQGPPR
ncbi:hypothetical protein DYH10_01150 [Candidatus Saccharibacteria bacterium CPR2]|nr:hypothetical protein [Candidatus Saccharibacteria bacterium CPR2]